MIVRLKGFNVDDIVAPNFSDVTGDNWFNRYLKAAFKAGILEEKEGENFRPNEPITRAELAQMISYIDKVNDLPILLMILRVINLKKLFLNPLVIKELLVMKMVLSDLITLLLELKLRLF